MNSWIVTKGGALENQLNSQGKRKNRAKTTQPPETEIQFLNELQEFLSEELIEQGTAYRRAFIPLTEGLGLESPVNLIPKIKPTEEIPEKLQQPEPKLQVKNLIPQTTEEKHFSYELDETRNQPPHLNLKQDKAENRLAEVMDPPPLAEKENSVEPPAIVRKLEVLSASDRRDNVQPPPLPRPSIFKRLLAGIIDHVFVLLIWTGLIVFTSNWLNGFTSGFSIEILTDFGQPKFQRIAILEFAAAWFGYLGFSLLIARKTFGMWVWSIGVSYGDKVEENYTMRKAMRIFWTFLFSAPIIPSIFLVIHRNGRNILDVLSGTNVYDSN